MTTDSPKQTYRICGTEFTLTSVPQEHDTQGRRLYTLAVTPTGHALSTTEPNAPLLRAVVDHIGTQISQRHTFSDGPTQYASVKHDTTHQCLSASFTLGKTVQGTPSEEKLATLLEALQTHYANKAPEALIHSHTRLVRSTSLNPQVKAVNDYLDQQAAALGLSDTQVRVLKGGIEGALTRAAVPDYYQR